MRAELPAYAAAGWLTPAEPFALGSMRARRLAREHARPSPGQARGARGRASTRRTPPRWRSCATGGASGRAGADFVVREQELLHELWQRREVARPALDYAARAVAPAPAPVPPVTWPPYGPAAVRYGPTTPYPSYSHVHGPGHHRPAHEPRPQPYRPRPVPRPTARTGTHPRRGTHGRVARSPSAVRRRSRRRRREARGLRLGQLQVRDREQRRELLDRAGGGDRGGHGRPGGEPGEGDRGDLGAPCRRRSCRARPAPCGRAPTPGAGRRPPPAGSRPPRPARYLPVRKPEASAKYGTAARPVRAAMSRSGPS